jgi:hypothetical protein
MVPGLLAQPAQAQCHWLLHQLAALAPSVLQRQLLGA